MSNPEATVRMSDVYKAFRSLQLTYGYFADALAGYFPAGLTDDNIVAVDPDTKSALAAVTDPEGAGDQPCDNLPWCHVTSADYVRLVDTTTKRAKGAADSLKALIESTDIRGVEFMAGSAHGWPYKDRHK